MRANGLCRISAVVLKSGKEGQFEKEGYGQVSVCMMSFKHVLLISPISSLCT